LIITLALTFFNGNTCPVGQWSPSVVLAVLVMSALFASVIFTSREVTTVADQTNEPLNPQRVQAGQVIALLTGILVARWNGYSGVVYLMPLWAAIVGVSLYRLFVLISKRI
jgi:hypothetical protein